MSHIRLRDLNDLFHYRGDAQVLISLASSPSLRFSKIALAVFEHTGDFLRDNEINRCLPRLEANGLLIAEGPRRRKTYYLSDRGRETAGLLMTLLDSFDRRGDGPPTAPDDPCDGS